MYIIFFLACVVAGSFAGDSESSEAKYIDLLPEREKKEFLNKIARRIFEEVQSKGGKNETSGEISEAILDAQSKFVEKLLQEESKSVRRTEINKLEDKDTQSSENSKEKESNPNMNEDDKIDLTLREGRRSKRNKSKETSEEEENNTNGTKIPENISVEISVIDKNETDSKEVKTEVNSDSGEKIPVKVVYDDISTSTKIEDTTKAALRVQNNTSIEFQKSHTEISEFSPEESKDVDSIEPSKVESTTVENESTSTNSETTTAQTVTETSDVKTGITERIYEPIRGEDSSSDSENKSQIDPNAKSSNESSSSSSAEKTQEETTVAEPDLKEVVENATESLKNETANSTQVEEPKDLTLALRTEKGNESKSAGNKNINDSTRRNYHILTTTSKENSGETTSKNPEDNFETTSDFKVLEKTKGKGEKASLRHGFFENSAETQIEDSKLFHEIKSRYNKDKVQNYEVYEITPDEVKPVVKQERKLKPIERNLQQKRKLKPIERNLQQQKEHPYYVPVYNYAPNKAYYRHSPDIGPFLKLQGNSKPVGRNSPVQGHPHYVPIYNYAPNNVFFNPYNRLGPNYGDKTHEIRHEDRPIAIESQKHLRGRQKPKDNLKDYNDMNFYLRKLHRSSNDYNSDEENCEKEQHYIKFPNSEEPSHPSNKEPFKNHLSAIRQIMYENKVFGYVPAKSTTKIPNTRITENLFDGSTTKKSVLNEGESRGYPAFGIVDWFNLRSKHDNYDQSSREYIYKQKPKIPYNDPITFDYYFGTDEAKRSKPDRIIKNPKTYEDTKEKRYLFGSSDPADLLPTLEKLESFKVKTTNEDLDTYLRVLKDMVAGNSGALNQYDWLRTTVDVRSALKKLSDLSQQTKSNAKIHPADMELFKYVLHLHKTTQSSLRDNDNNEDSLIPAVISNRGLLPRNRHRNGHKVISMKSKLNRVWLRVIPGNTEFRKDLADFDDFLYDLGLGLYELHNTINHVASITKYNNQRWYINLKELYLSKATKKDLLGLLLHLSTSRLMTLLEISSNNGLEDGFSQYMEKNVDEVRQTKEEFLFVIRILDEFNENY